MLNLVSKKPLYSLCVIVLAVLLAACQAPGVHQRSLAYTSDTDSLIKPETDKRMYRYLVLDNGLKVLLVSDPASEKAAASMDIKVGSRFDPKEHQGLAHFLEHMLFLGTEKYPNAGEYQAYINKHGGNHNAYTSFEHTNYFFDIAPESFEPALDRFAQFFISPLFTADLAVREKNAVHSEYVSKLHSQQRRSLDALKAIVNPAHPFHAFSVGSLETLTSSSGDSVRQELMTFYQQYYRANRMTLVLIAPDDLDRLELMLKARFKQILSGNSDSDVIHAPLFPEGILPSMLSIKPEKELRQLSLTFPIPDSRALYREKPLAYLAHLIGHEGEASLLDYLKGKGFAEALSAGQGLSYEGGGTFNVSIRLTPEGVANWQSVVRAVFASLNRIEQEGVNEWRYEELALMGEQAFQFQERGSAMHRAIGLASGMHVYPPQEVLAAPYRYSDYNEELIRKYLSYLKPGNLLITLTDPNVDTDKLSSWYASPYRLQRLETVFVKNLNDQLAIPEIALPNPNPYLPNTFDVYSEEKKYSKEPVLVLKQPRLRLWFKHDEVFNKPKNDIFINFKSALASESASAAAALVLYSELLQDDLKVYSYPAALAGLGFSITPHSRGLSLRLGGFDDKQKDLLTTLLTHIQAGSLSADRFEILKGELVDHWQNDRLSKPYQRLLDDLAIKIQQPGWSKNTLALALNELSFDTFSLLIKRFWASYSVEVFAHGNLSKTQALKLGSLPLIKQLPDASQKEHQAGVLQIAVLPKGQVRDYVLVDQASNAALLYFQGADTMLDRAFFLLTEKLLSSGFYHELRTQRQLGYIVNLQALSMLDVPGLALIVQSPGHSTEQISAAFKHYLNETVAPESVSIDMFEQVKQAVSAEILAPPTTIRASTERFWRDIALGKTAFDEREKLARLLSSIELTSWRSWYAKTVLNNPKSILLVTANAGEPEVRSEEQVGLDTSPSWASVQRLLTFITR
jgi:secreted Zn-dependent insulinase-like peptidase